VGRCQGHDSCYPPARDRIETPVTDQISPDGGSSNGGQAASFTKGVNDIQQNIARIIRGKDEAIRMTLVCMLAEGHVLIEDVPGTGKTSLAKAISQSIDGSLRRIQFTPDLLPSDVTGVMIYDPGKREFNFRPGPIFANIVLADEINRASPKTQSALLEVMAERQVTIDSVPYLTSPPFFVVLATQNPVEHSGTYDLPEAQLDRFMMRITLGYPDHDEEMQVVGNAATGRTTDQLKPVMSAEQFGEMISVVRKVHVSTAVLGYIVTICAATRTMDDLRLGVSPRGAVLVAQAAQALAATRGRAFVSPDDVKAVVPYVLPHRMIMRPEAELQGKSPNDLINEVMASVRPPQQRASV